jgi:vancomycin resistance protein YoaR
LKRSQVQLLLLILFALGFCGEKLVSMALAGLTIQTLNQAAEIQDPHPFGRPVEGPLQWENDPQFQAICQKYGATLRMAAFQTTLPDPLPGEEYNVALGARILSGAIAEPGKTFSLNKRIGPYSAKRGYQDGPTYVGTQVFLSIGGGVCKIASTLYNVTMLANLPIVERHPHSMLVPYVPAGQDATVADGGKDFKFKNDRDYPLLIWSGTKDNTLSIAFYGRSVPPKVTWRHQIMNRQKTYTVYRYNKNLAPGIEKTVIPGADGLTVKTWVIIAAPPTQPCEKYLGMDYYRPLPNVVERGPMKQRGNGT